MSKPDGLPRKHDPGDEKERQQLLRLETVSGSAVREALGIAPRPGPSPDGTAVVGTAAKSMEV